MVPTMVRAGVVAGFLLWGSAARSAGPEAPLVDRKEVGRRVAAGLKDWLEELARQGRGRKPIVAVLPPADARGEIPLVLAETSAYLEGETIAAIREAVGDRAVIWGPEAVSGTLRASSIEPRAVRLTDDASVRGLLAQIGGDAAVIGRIDAPPVRALRDGTATPFNVLFRTIPGPGSPPAPASVPVTAHPDLIASPWDSGQLSGRFEVEFRVNGEAVPLAPHPDGKAGSVDNVFLATLDPRKHVGPDRSSPCSFVVKNRGSGDIGIKNPLNNRRLFGVVLSLDGYNAIKEKDAKGVFQFAKRAPENSRKWVLTGPNWRMVPARNDNGFDLIPTGDAGGSTWEIKGFQEGQNTASQFILTTNADRWVARGDADRSSLGWITVHIFAQKLPGDTLAGAFGDHPAGVAAGTQIAQKTFDVKVEWYAKPLESWRIYYGARPSERLAEMIPIAD